MELIGRDEVEASVEELIGTVTPDLYQTEDIVKWETVFNRLRAWRKGIQALENLTANAHGEDSALARVLEEEPSAYELLKTLLVIRSAVGFADGRELPERLSDEHTSVEVAKLLQDIGIWQVLEPNVPVEPMVRVALIAKGADRRRFGVRGRLDQLVEQALMTAIKTAEQETGLQLAVTDSKSVPTLERGITRALDYVLMVEGSPFAVVNHVFQTTSGGRQQRDLSRTYPALQAQLDELPAGLILIVDGRGIRATPRRVLREMVSGVAACMTLRQAEEGTLATTLVDLAKRTGIREELNAPIDRLIGNALDNKTQITVSDLPVNEDRGRLALARYQDDHPEVALSLAPDSTALAWTRSELVAQAGSLPILGAKRAVDAALEVFADLLGASLIAPPSQSLFVEGSSRTVLEKEQEPILPTRMLVMSIPDIPTAAVLKSTAKESAKEVSEAGLAVLLTPTAPPPDEFTALQATLAATVIVLDYEDLVGLAQGAGSPRDGFVVAVLERGDVAKVSPFVVRSVTPERMFFGRDREHATLVSTLSSNSVALLGGRRIGKTSLLRRAESWLREADFFPVFGDCQTVGSWEQFGRLVRRDWKCDAPKDFTPADLFDVVEELNAQSHGRLVFLLDEIDHLLRWDQDAEFEGVKEGFFRACRTISQQGSAQFVFSGERTIANKLWDPHSPHWNFCRPLQLRQLEREATKRLLTTPLVSLGIELLDEEEFRRLTWQFTSGHPQLVQFLGDSLVDLVSSRPRGARSHLTPADLREVVERLAYVDQYLQTYWGQTTDEEKLVSALVASGLAVPQQIAERLSLDYEVPLEEDDVVTALRMLELYGIVDRNKAGYELRPEWFSDALGWYGGGQKVAQRYASKVVG